MSETTVTLAHPWRDPNTDEKYLPGDPATLPVDQARGLAAAGYVQGVDPNDREALRRFSEPDAAEDAEVPTTAAEGQASAKPKRSTRKGANG